MTRARRAVESENTSASRGASQLTEADARWIFAAKVGQSLQGGRTAALPADRRERLIRIATRMGLRPFDANLVIAIVQDAVRTGEQAPGHGPADTVTERVAMVREPAGSNRGPRRVWFTVLLALTSALLTGWLLLGWLMADAS